MKAADWSWRGRAAYDNDFIAVELAHLDVGKNFNPEIKFSKALFVNLGYTLDDVQVPQGSFKAHVVNSRANYSFSNNLLTSVTVTYNSLAHLFNTRFRLNYIFRKNDNFFIVYDEGRGADGHSRRALTAKFTYSFDFK